MRLACLALVLPLLLPCLASADPLNNRSAGLSSEQKRFLDSLIDDEEADSLKRIKAKGTLIYPRLPKGLFVRFGDHRDFVMMVNRTDQSFPRGKPVIDRKKNCLRYARERACLVAKDGVAVEFDEIWEDWPPIGGVWARSYWRAGRFVCEMTFDDSEVTMIRERDWCTARGRCEQATSSD